MLIPDQKPSQEIVKLVGHHSRVKKVEFTRNSSTNQPLLASCSDAKVVRLWSDLQNGQFANLDLGDHLPLQTQTISDIAFTPLGDYLLFGSNLGEFGVSKVDSRESMVLERFGESVDQIEVTSDGVLAAMLLSKKMINFYSLVKQKQFYQTGNQFNTRSTSIFESLDTINSIANSFMIYSI